MHSYGDPPPDLPALAAAYAHGIAHLHPFVDGNKRTSFVAALLFLRVNGQDIRASQEERYTTWLAFAAGDLDQTTLAARPRDRPHPAERRATGLLLPHPGPSPTPPPQSPPRAQPN